MIGWRIRFVRFNLVSALGVAVQLTVLWWLVGVMDDLRATVFAVMAAAIHNFAWHWQWTWADRRHGDGRMWSHLMRFLLGNGVISLVGNTVCMLVLVRGAALRPLAANLVVIGLCGLLNFWVVDRGVFGPSKPTGT